MTTGKNNIPCCHSNSLCALGWLAFLLVWRRAVAHQSIRDWKGESGDYIYGAVALFVSTTIFEFKTSKIVSRRSQKKS
jgi:hypothetical protein